MTLGRLGQRGFLLLAFLTFGCNGDGEAAATMEAGRIVHAVEMLRRAPPEDKGPPLAALEALDCTDDRCSLKDVCVEAYGLHVRGIQGLRAARKALEGSADPATAAAAGSLTAAERDLKRSAELAKECAELEGEISRRYGLD